MKRLLKMLLILLGIYVAICLLLFLFQEKLIFFPEKLDKKFSFAFDQPFEEITITTNDNIKLNALLFKAASSKGLIFYLHGNAGSLNTWGDVPGFYTGLGYDVFMLDYRGYGKSEGSISSQVQLFSDVQLAYDEMKKRYTENKIVVLGHSVGTGPAANIAATNKPRMLILLTPYYSMTDMMRHRYPVVPTFILKYKFATNEYIKACNMSIVLVHGDKDEVIYYKSSVKLKALMKASDTLITLEGQGHNGITENAVYRKAIGEILESSK